MSAAYSNLFLDQGSSFSTTITLDDVYGELYDLSYFTAKSQIKKSYYSANVTAQFETNIDIERSTISLDLSANTTANIAAGRYVYDTFIIDTNNNTSTKILEGILDVAPSVTR
jgi:hypothetical protein